MLPGSNVTVAETAPVSALRSPSSLRRVDHLRGRHCVGGDRWIRVVPCEVAASRTGRGSLRACRPLRACRTSGTCGAARAAHRPPEVKRCQRLILDVKPSDQAVLDLLCP